MAITKDTERQEGKKPLKGKPFPPKPPKGPSPTEALNDNFQAILSKIQSFDFLKKVAWAALLALFYAFSQSMHDKLTLDIYRTKREMNEMKALYVSRNADYMYASKQSEITKRIEDRGLDKSIVPPIKIVVQEEEN